MDGMKKIFVWILVVGTAGGATGVVYLKFLHELSLLLGPEHWTPWAHLVVLTFVGAAISLLIKWLGSPGDVELMVNNIHMRGGHKDVEQLKSLLPVSLLCVAAGGPAGPEAPLVQTTGTLGTWIAERQNLSKENIRILTITGMSAGLTVLFGAPLGAAVFALEILHRRGLEYFEALLPATIGSLCGYAFFTLATGLGLTPIWSFSSPASLHNMDLAWSVAAGLIAAPIVAVFTFAHIYFRKFFHLFPIFWRPILGGLILGGLAFCSPYALGFGEEQIGALSFMQGAATFWVGILLVKMAANAFALSSGWRGGFIIPLFFIGLCLAKLLHLQFPSTNESLMMAALMASMTTGVTKTPLGSTLVITEMVGIQLLPTTLIACLVTMLLTSEFGLIHSQQKRDDLSR
jgi:H+/Cl- antiporter ClcA